MKRLSLILSSIVLSLPVVASAQTDTAFTYQGELSQNNNVTNGQFAMEFSLWDSMAGGNQIGSTLVSSVTVQESRFSVELDFGAEVFDEDERWLELTVENNVLSPRQQVNRTPYAIQTRGLFVNSLKNVGIGTINPQRQLDLESLESCVRLTTTDAAPETMSRLQLKTVDSTGNVQPMGQIDFVDQGDNINALVRGEVVNGQSRLNFSVSPQSNPQLAINSAGVDVTGRLDVTENVILEKDLNVSDVLMVQDVNGEDKVDVAGDMEVIGTTDLMGDFCVVGLTDLVGNVCVIGQTLLDDELCVNGNTELNANVCVQGQTELASGLNVSDFTSLNNGACIMGANLDVLSTTNFDSQVFMADSVAIAASTADAALNVGTDTIPESGLALHVKTQDGNGIRTETFGSTSIALIAEHSAGGTAASFSGDVVVDGDLAVNGSLSKASGSFKIDHPLDPKNKYLYHSFVESPDMMNIYNGVVTTDERGYATVAMPDWFEALNRDFRYQLTVVDTSDTDDFVLAKIVEEINGNQFRLRTSRPETKVSWQVTGIRNDAYAIANRIPVEQDKVGSEVGKYLYPRAYELETTKQNPKLQTGVVQSFESDALAGSGVEQ